jgi:hypothetical protein
MDYYSDARFRNRLEGQFTEWNNWANFDPSFASTCNPCSTPELPEGYSIGLYQTVTDMLRYNPYRRPDLESLQQTINRHLKRLDGQYGNKTAEPEDSIPAVHRVLRVRSFQEFEKGTWFESVKKRKVQAQWGQSNIFNVRAGQNDYTRLRDQWEQGHTTHADGDFAAALRRLERAGDMRTALQQQVVQNLADIGVQGLHNAAAIVNRGFSIQRKAIDPGAVQDQHTGYDAPSAASEVRALTLTEHQYAFLQALLLPGLRRLRGEIPNDLRTVMEHGIELTLAFLRMASIPEWAEDGLSTWHYAVIDVIRWYPSGAWSDKGNEDDEDEDDGDGNGGSGGNGDNDNG